MSDSPPLPKAPGVKIIRKGDEATWRDGYRLLTQAKEVYESERAKGFAEGKTAGTQEAAKLVVETAAKVERYLATLDQQVAALAMDVVRRVLGQFDQADLVARAAAHALADFRHEKALKITVHPSAYQQVSEVITRVDRQLTIQVDSDPSAAPDRCLIASEFAVVDASIDTQLAMISKVLGLPDQDERKLQ
jgi:type III secretion protein L